LTAQAASLISIPMLMVTYQAVSPSIYPILGIAVLLALLVFMVSAIAAIHYSATGGRVEGSTLDWIIATVISPYMALFLYLLGHWKGKDKEAIDADDRRRLDRL
jgi:uncharacterized membrane protein